MLIILCAMQKEAVNINCPDALIFQTGIGGSNVIKRLQKLNINSSTDKIINIGYAGSTLLKPGEVVTVKKVSKLKPSYTIKEKPVNLKPIDNLEAQDCFTTDNFYENDKHEVSLVDMELYYISLIFPQVQAIKIVSDNAHYQSYKTFNSQAAWDKVNQIIKELGDED